MTSLVKKTIRLVLADQLTHSLASLRDIDLKNDLVMLCEVMDEVRYVPHHKRKVAFLFSAMRHFAEELRQKGVSVRYVKLNDEDNTGSFTSEIHRALTQHQSEKIILTEPGEYRVRTIMEKWTAALGVDVEIRDDDRFLCTPEDFSVWAKGRKQLRMDFFYRVLRRRYNILMEGDKPIGNKWNYDSENRKPPDLKRVVPEPYRCSPDQITTEVLSLVRERCADHFGLLEEFDYAVDRNGALEVLAKFIEERLPLFGQFQDAMIEGEPWMYHSHIGLYLNAGLLTPMEVIQSVEKEFYEGRAPLNSVEGFIRQVMGWREFIRGIYWLKMPNYAALNYLEASRPLPEFFWSGQTDMNCMRQSILQTKRFAYAHHIQRLMVLGNFSLLTGIDPVMVNEWYLVVYVDAFEWVELPNVSGMVLFADGGYLASKPYAASGAYINRMSNYCKNCKYKVRQKSGEEACPFNYLYWDFLARNRDKLAQNARLGMMYRSLDKMSDVKTEQIRVDAATFFEKMDKGRV